jgi:hypothetical protein
MLPSFQREVLGDLHDISRAFSWVSGVRAGHEWGLVCDAFGTGDRISRGRCHDISLRRLQSLIMIHHGSALAVYYSQADGFARGRSDRHKALEVLDLFDRRDMCV